MYDAIISLLNRIRKVNEDINSKQDAIVNNVASNTQAVQKQTAYFYDYAVRRAGGRLLANVDFTINKELFPVDEFDLKYCLLIGDYESYEIVKWEELGLPRPPFTGSPYVLKVRLAPGGTVYVLFPLPSEPAVPYASYITAYAENYEIDVNQYIAIDADPSNIRNNWIQDWKQLPDTWARVCNCWALEINWALTSHCYKMTNPNTNPVDVYIAGCLASQLSFLLKGWSILYGYIDGYEFTVSNTTLSQTLRIFLPQSIGQIYLMQTDGKIRGDGTNPFTVTHYLNNKLLLEKSQTANVDVLWAKQFKVSNIYTKTSRFESLLIKVTMNTAGTGVMSRFTYILFGSALEPEIPDYLEGTALADQYTTLYDFTNTCDYHIREIHELELSTDASVTEAYAEVHDAKTGWKKITPSLGPSETYKIQNLKLRAVGLRIYSAGGTTAYKCRTILSDSFLIWE